VLRTVSPAAALLILLSIASPLGATDLEEEPAFPVLEAGTVQLELDSRRFTLEYSRTALGPLFALQQLVSRLGGDLRVGPLGQSHELEVTGTDFIFGPEGSALTYGDEIESLSQSPVAGLGGLHVPLDLLRSIYTRSLGYEFSWRADVRVLAVRRQAAREIPMSVELVHLQGVTTMVFQFPTKPRYRLEHLPSRIEIELLGDRLVIQSRRPFPPDQFVRNVRLTPQKIVIDLAPQVTGQDYTLESPFRLVFDFLRDTTAAVPAAVEAPTQPTREPGVNTIIIDPGHGGSNTGAVGRDGTLEKEVALQLARMLRRRLEQRFPVRVVLTREEDVEIPLDTRSSIANQFKGDLFVSLHLNSSPDPSSHGAETFFLSLEPSDERAALAVQLENQGSLPQVGDELYDLQLILWDLAQSSYMAASQRLATLVQAELNETLGLRNRGVKQAPFRVLLGVAMPAILVELGFLSNPEEEKRLAEFAFRAELVDALVRAVSRYVAETEGGPVAQDDIARP
jgi:N-acetylmuramoyl-L-alanine amidase